MFSVLFAASLSVYPLAGNYLLVVLVAYALLLLWRPTLWLLAMPALLPVLDLAPQTGWFFLEEIDLLLMLTAMFAYWNLPTQPADMPEWPLLFRCGAILLAVACAIGLWRGLQPWPGFGVNTFNNYLSPGNALRTVKGWLWAFILAAPLKHAAGPQLKGLRGLLMPGMMLGLLLVSATAIRERMQFPGLLNFASDYRITGPFSAMHTGGAALDGYFALALPLLAVWLVDRGAPARNIGATALLPLALYAALATFSRGLYLGLLTAVVILTLPSLLKRPALMVAGGVALAALDGAFRVAGYRAFGLLLLIFSALTARLSRTLLAGLLVLSAAVPVYHGYYVGERFSTIAGDWQHRLRHWRQVLGMMNGALSTAVFGMGLGSFPATYFWHNPQRELPPSYQFVDDGSNRHLRLAAGEYAAGYGELLRMLQAVTLRPHTRYLLSVEVRNFGKPGFLHIGLCQRHLLYPQSCVATPLRQISSAPDWGLYQYTIDSGLLGADKLPVKLEMAAEGQRVVLDIDNISLRAFPDGAELLRNGSFEDANRHWFFSSDRNHLPWHIKNLALNLYFELGSLGLIAYGMMMLSAVSALLQPRDAPWLAALVAFQVVGLFDSLIDVPRITLLSTLLLCAANLQTKARP
ncbi:hypothetical protein KW842_03115 [Duganella sp. sic0402]|uniref:hypothetical protein n=1 Tax=Duganella sp. sic0402 TaxID=2854786 RepID=UPI001C450EA0|nr:hypothetical protein [Duganella sp. sic0402]MBV7534749.1 hypothetical protein [Duganella sp. sic0402]